MIRICSFLFVFFMLSSNSTTAQPSELYPTAALSTTWTTDYNYDRPIIRRGKGVVKFTCGFFCEGDCTSNIFAIFIVRSRSNYALVWSANRDYPVKNNATLDFTAAGELVLKDVDGSIVWTTNTTGKSVVGMNLTDTGNLVLFDDQNSIVWQSFDHPTDCLLPGQTLYEGQKLQSSVSSTNLSKGMFSLQVTNIGLVAYVESSSPQIYSRLSVDRHITNRERTHIRFLNGSLSIFINSSKPAVVIDIPPASVTQYMKLMPDGHLKVFEWQPGKRWTVIADLTTHDHIEECDYPLTCGRNSICSPHQQCICPTKEYFRPVNELQPEQGCSEITPLTCGSTQNQDFIKLENVTYFTLDADMYLVDLETCKQACLKNCSCKAAFFFYFSNPSDGACSLTSELFTMQKHDQVDYPTLAFIKVKNITSLPWNVTTPPVSNQVAIIVGSTVGGVVLLFAVTIGFIICVVHKRKRDAKEREDYLDQVPGMPNQFSYDELKTATNNFTKKLGEGGFGSVFEGSLKDGSKIAVKCLEGHSHIKKSFLAEVQSIGSIHHVNLVRLRGFCTWKSQRFLVYDFMSNGSLDQWIYHRNREHILEWACRKKIILNIAKGLSYLHEECRQKIIHLDIKPQNILLDNEFNAKVSDFGLSKLMDKNQSQVMTTMRGTPGYLAPEWLSSIITEKVDVYSFGIVLLEILCGRKIFDRSQPEESWHLLSVFQNCWEQGTLLDIVDMSNEDMQIYSIEVLEMMKIASWCLQTDYTRRPLMSSV